jgi:hypothetical protein
MLRGAGRRSINLVPIGIWAGKESVCGVPRHADIGVERRVAQVFVENTSYDVDDRARAKVSIGGTLLPSPVPIQRLAFASESGFPRLRRWLISQAVWVVRSVPGLAKNYMTQRCDILRDSLTEIDNARIHHLKNAVPYDCRFRTVRHKNGPAIEDQLGGLFSSFASVEPDSDQRGRQNVKRKSVYPIGFFFAWRYVVTAGYHLKFSPKDPQTRSTSRKRALIGNAFFLAGPLVVASE